MNASITRLFWVVVLLFGLLIAFTSRWTVFEAKALRENAFNKRPLLEEQQIKRGTILAADGTVLARSIKEHDDLYRRSYPDGGLFAHAVGYSFTDLGRSGLERSRNDILTGNKGEVFSAVDSLLGYRREGEEIQTTLNPKAQRAALNALKGKKGAVVAIDAGTGAVVTLASSPTFNPNNLDRKGRFKELSQDEANAPMFNRATQAVYPPGSTFKVITATTALDSGKFTPDSVLNGDTNKTFSTVALANFGNKSWGNISLTTALTNSVNTVWAQVGQDVGRDAMAKYMQRFGFYSKPKLDYPESELVASGLRRRDNGKLLPAQSELVDVGRMAIGQERLSVTPLQMAIVAATIANGGVRMQPFLTSRVVDSDGRTVKKTKPKVAEQVMKRRTAAELTKMMTNVVREGSGTAAALSGVQVAGKTGTAEVNPKKGINDAWFIGFSDGLGDSKYAVAVVVERVHDQGGVIAAPIARSVLHALEGRG